MSLHPGAQFELVWRNDELSNSPDERPDGFTAESRATCGFVEIDPPRFMRYIWPGVGGVSIELEEKSPPSSWRTWKRSRRTARSRRAQADQGAGFACAGGNGSDGRHTLRTDSIEMLDVVTRPK